MKGYLNEMRRTDARLHIFSIAGLSSDLFVG
jgi:hypothetical protein